MDLLETVSSGPYMTIPVTARDKHLFGRYPGDDGVQLVVETVLFCVWSPLLRSVYRNKVVYGWADEKLQQDDPVCGALDFVDLVSPLPGQEDTHTS